MDQKLQGLDPKLQDAYKRVMGTPNQTQTHAQDHSPTLVAIDTNPKKQGATNKSGVSPVILLIAAVVFFVVYAIFWVRFFGISIPGLPF